ncbi:Na/Pi cotransporter family protein [Thalassotalea euphylliae]|uniref:Na/Pi cotransporter family protein n=1 Tax=Thalassotalea euphylliae TaxID=1655234 RepID=UPI0036315650
MFTPTTIAPKKILLFLLAFATLFMCNFTAVASDASHQNIAWSEAFMGLLGGLALFLFGMEQMSDALKSALGDQMKMLLAKLTKNRFTGALTGAFVTAVIQSSSVTTVLVVGFVSAGMMTMSQSIGVIMGANVGTTITAQIVAFKVEEAALWMVASGFLMMFAGKREKTKHYGNMLMGLGLIFYGMSLMGEAMEPLRRYPPFLELMVKMDEHLLAIMVGALFTALVQSSSATTAIVITMAGQGLISLEAGIALAFGANVGTCITAQLAALGKSREALRAAVVHLVFNLGGVLIWLPFIGVLASWIVTISPQHPELFGTARLAAEVPRQIANAHTVFNVFNTLFFLSLTGFLAQLVLKLVPEKAESLSVIIKPKFLDNTLIDTPSLAIERARLEVARMASIVTNMFEKIREDAQKRDGNLFTRIKLEDDKVDLLQGEIYRYLSDIRKQPLNEQQSKELSTVMLMADEIESVGDVLENDLARVAKTIYDNNLKSSNTIRYIYREIGDKLSVALQNSTLAIKDNNQIAAQSVLSIKGEIDTLIKQAFELQTEKFTDENIELVRHEMTILENLKRIHTYLKRIAKRVVPQEIDD